jgi:hypothetical protein
MAGNGHGGGGGQRREDENAGGKKLSKHANLWFWDGYDQDFHFRFLASPDYTSDRLCSSVFSSFPS